jgi:competence protein ComEC
MRSLASAIAVSWAVLVWTLPLQLLHFGSTPLYALVANLLAAHLLAHLTLPAMDRHMAGFSSHRRSATLVASF